MLERKERLNEVYEHLHNQCGVHTKAEFADRIQYARAYVSSALNGNEKYLTDKLFRSICEKFPQFNLDYLLTGNGEQGHGVLGGDVLYFGHLHDYAER